ncbi:DUF488 domain-containing protein [Nodularia sp. UHCC 0506]|uniref:DUF488 domain-containing protein n=1 Tax=Nodularia sp. UHCC 0506 TaxID=3110243 RepID=UPI002B1F2BD3|nr:DUF488 domain-containing protein [Nodularia sp. UHCC 0506]MEA5512611.1 DUF488 domain-containing protein [Nodularia sp. UHCC 0506]
MEESNFLNRYILTFGYGNRKNYEEFLKYLEDFSVEYVVDVRKVTRAWSRQWYGEKINNFCHLNNIKYISKTKLGNTSGNKNWIPENPEAAKKELDEVAEIAKLGNILLLCAEKNASHCHRTEVANKLKELTAIPVKHLE